MTHKKILFVGAGAIGSYIGSFLTRAGHDVTLIDPWAEQVETVRAKGIGVTGPHDPFTARPKIYHLHEAQRVPRDGKVHAIDQGSLNGTFLGSAGGQRITEVQLKRGDTLVLADNAAAFLYQI